MNEGLWLDGAEVGDDEEERLIRELELALNEALDQLFGAS